MTTIKTDFAEGGANLPPNQQAGSPDLATTLRDMADDLAELRAKLIATHVKLDADAGVTDTNYASTLVPAALKTVKG